MLVSSIHYNKKLSKVPTYASSAKALKPILVHLHSLIGGTVSYRKEGISMPPRPMSPFQPPNPRMMHPMMNRGGFPPMNGMGPRPGMGPRSGMGAGPGMRGPQRGGGGLLSRLFGRGGGQAAGTTPFSFPARSIGPPSAGGAAGSSGGLLRTLTNPNALSGFLTNTQKVLNTAQQVGPMIQQYGPLVRNIPSLWKLYRGLKNAPDGSEEEKEQEKTKEKPVRKKSKTKSHSKPSTEEKAPEKTGEEQKNNKGQSVPKLYI